MKPLFVILSLVVVVASSGRALAVNIMVQVTQDNVLENGFKVSVEENGKGLLVWTIERDLSKARSFPPASKMTIRRRAMLTLYDDDGVAAKAPLEPTTSAQRKNVLTYWFKTSHAFAPHAHLTVTEHLRFKDPSRGPLLGGGTYFELPLSKLVILPASPGDKAE